MQLPPVRPENAAGTRARYDFCSMNYQHAYHAGNFADVIKHVAQVAILLHLRKKKSPFAVIDSHAGRGLYDLRSVQAGSAAEWQNGIGRLRDLSGVLPEPLSVYLNLANEYGTDKYPGSALIAAKLLRSQDRLTAIEKNPKEAQALHSALAEFSGVIVQNGDGYKAALKLLPPAARRGLVVIDPPFEAKDEFLVLAQNLHQAIRRFANGIYLIWYPIKSRSSADCFLGEIMASGAAKLLKLEIAVAPQAVRMTCAGVLVINPPYGFDRCMGGIASILSPLLGQSGPATIDVAWLAGGDTPS